MTLLKQDPYLPERTAVGALTITPSAPYLVSQARYADLSHVALSLSLARISSEQSPKYLYPSMKIGCGIRRHALGSTYPPTYVILRGSIVQESIGIPQVLKQESMKPDVGMLVNPGHHISRHNPVYKSVANISTVDRLSPSVLIVMLRRERFQYEWKP